MKNIREWIIDAIKWLRNIGQILNLRVKEITVEIGLTPKVSITFIPPEFKSKQPKNRRKTHVKK